MAEIPVDCFELFFDSDLINLFVEQTNIYALQKNKPLNVSEGEMKVFLARLLLSSISPQPNKNKYWSSADHVPKILAKSIRRDRFLAIMRNVHLVNNLNFAASTDRDKKRRPLFNQFQRSFKKHGKLKESLSIDESMIPYFGKHFAKQFISGKPIMFGYKMWAMCYKGGYLNCIWGRQTIHSL